MQNTIDINQVADLVADEGQYPARNGHRNPAEPAWIFRSDAQTETSDTLWGRELALDFEEWQARREQQTQLQSGEFVPGFVSGIDYTIATLDEIQDWMDKPVKGKKPVMLTRGPDGELVEWSPKTEKEAEAYFERQTNREFCNWLVGWHKRRPSSNDHWRRFVAPLANVLDDKALGITAKTILQTMRDTLPFAPGPVKDTIFINPDGSRVVTRIAPGNARAGYKERHKLTDELVTMDRVQFEGERTSRYVIGTRKASDKTPSNYYDPDPVKGDRGYVPRACMLMRLDPKKPIMPDEHCYRLTVRELERAIIAGAELCEDEFDAVALGFEDQDSQFDTRESGLSFDDTCDFRTLLDLTEQEQWLYWTLFGAGMEDACSAMLTRQPGDIARYLPGLDGACLKLGTDAVLTNDEEIAHELLMAAQAEDQEELDRTGRVQWSRFAYLKSVE